MSMPWRSLKMEWPHRGALCDDGSATQPLAGERLGEHQSAGTYPIAGKLHLPEEHSVTDSSKQPETTPAQSTGAASNASTTAQRPTESAPFAPPKPRGGGRTRVLVVDDDEAMREVLRERLQQWGYDVELSEGVADARRRAQRRRPDLVVSDVVMNDGTGVDLLRSLVEAQGEVPVILITAHATVDLSVEAMKLGATDFLTKPLDYGKLRSTIDAADHEMRARRKQRSDDDDLAAGAAMFGDLVGASPAMQRVYELIQQVAQTDAPVLLTGESGTGKEVTARTVHRMSGRRNQAFLAINAAAIPSELMESEIFGHEKGAFTGATTSRPGCFEIADGGTLFLDEIAEMSMQLQPKLLRILEEGTVRRLGGHEERKVDVRVLAATNQDPQQAIAEGRLRADLFYRLDVFGIRLPPLRERGDDIGLLTRYFLKLCRDKHGAATPGLRESAAALLQRYSWPGNVRELRNVVERAVIVARDSWIEPGHLPPYLEHPTAAKEHGSFVPQPGQTVAEVEKELILRTLEQTDNNKAEAARRLGIDVKTVRNKLKSYGLS